MLLDFLSRGEEDFLNPRTRAYGIPFGLFPYLQDGMEQSASEFWYKSVLGFQKFCELCEIFKMIDLIANSGSKIF